VVRIRQHLKPDEELTLTALYKVACSNPSDFHEHVPTLYGLAKQCAHVTEIGCRNGISTTAMLFAQPSRLICYDRVKAPEIDLLERAAARTTLEFRLVDGLDHEIDATELLFVAAEGRDSERLAEALARLAPKVKRFIAVHGTKTVPGIWEAVEKFAGASLFKLIRHDENNSGLVVLERVAR
jgi:hypothetical protein